MKLVNRWSWDALCISKINFTIFGIVILELRANPALKSYKFTLLNFGLHI